jgi:2-oxoglutarate ferredoxin oxidoreductase subunit beta
MGDGGVVMDSLSTRYLRAKKIPSTACGGCGLGQVHKKILMAMDELALGVGDVVWGSGIGCAGRQTFNTWKGDNFAGTHGRVYAIATGLRLALPEDKKIIITSGDGDAFGIGLSHLLHCARRNVDITVIVADNLGYQSTGGQYGYTTPLGFVSDSSPYGAIEQNWIQNGIDILDVLRAGGATFLARHSSLEGYDAVKSVKAAIKNVGFSLIHFIYPCVSHFGPVSLKTRDIDRIFHWFKGIFEAGGVFGENFKSGIFHDAGNSRPEFASSLRSQRAEVEAGHLR